MSGMASSYDIPMLMYGEAAAIMASIAAIYAVVVTTTTANLSGLVPFMLVTVSYGVMMFASSYIEEEQHFWYWITSAWLCYLAIRS